MTVCSQVAGVPCPPAAANSAAETTVRHQTLFMVQPSSVRMVSTRSMPGRLATMAPVWISSASSAVETRLASCWLPVSARAFSTTASSEHTASMTAEIKNRKAVWLTVTPSVRHRSSRNETMRMGSRKTLLGSSKIVHSAAHPRHSAVRAPPAIQ